MKRFLIVVDMQKDFVDGALGTPEAQAVVPAAARRIAEGFPFSFSEGTAASTGTTSVLYPFVLALPYAIGFTGGALFAAGFLLNAVFYVLFVLGWSAVACRAFAERPAPSAV